MQIIVFYNEYTWHTLETTERITTEGEIQNDYSANLHREDSVTSFPFFHDGADGINFLKEVEFEYSSALIHLINFMENCLVYFCCC